MRALHARILASPKRPYALERFRKLLALLCSLAERQEDRLSSESKSSDFAQTMHPGKVPETASVPGTGLIPISGLEARVEDPRYTANMFWTQYPRVIAWHVSTNDSSAVHLIPTQIIAEPLAGSRRIKEDRSIARSQAGYCSSSRLKCTMVVFGIRRDRAGVRVLTPEGWNAKSDSDSATQRSSVALPIDRRSVRVYEDGRLRDCVRLSSSVAVSYAINPPIECPAMWAKPVVVCVITETISLARPSREETSLHMGAIK